MRLGEHTIDSEVDCHEDEHTNTTVCSDPPVDINVEKILIHPRFHETSMQMVDDIALIRLEKSVKFTSK